MAKRDQKQRKGKTQVLTAEAAPDRGASAGQTQDEDDEVPQKSGGMVMMEQVLWIGAAVMAALLLRWGVVELFTIPTGSMEPTLHGRTDGGDRILCTKWTYRLRKPNRWEVIVFKFPYEQALRVGHRNSVAAKYKKENFIKRCVGLPGETIRLYHGDVYVKQGKDGFVRQIKPDSVQRKMWIPVYAEDFSDLSADDLAAFWKSSGTGQVSVTGAHTLKIETAGHAHLTYQPRTRQQTPLEGVPDRYVRRQVMTFCCPECGAESMKTFWNQKIAARCPKCGAYLLENAVTDYQRRSSLYMPPSHPLVTWHEGDGDGGAYVTRNTPWHEVPDLRVCFRFQKVGEAVEIAAELRDNARLTEARLLLGKENVIMLCQQGRPLVQIPLKLSDQSWHEFEFYQVEGVARLFIDGASVIEQELPVVTQASEEQIGTGIRLEVAKGTAELDNLSIDRDVYYYADPDSLFLADGIYAVPEDNVVALGDNCPASNDSRNWGPVPVENLQGPAVCVWWPPHRAHLLR